MSRPGEWIDFAELCRRIPGKSARTLRRLYQGKVISYRQTVRGGRVEFNWHTVQRELAIHETRSTHAEAAALIALPERPAPELTAPASPAVLAEIASLRALVEAMASKLGVTVQPRQPAA